MFDKTWKFGILQLILCIIIPIILAISIQEKMWGLIATCASIVVLVYICIYIYKLANKINEPKGLLYLSFFIPLVGLILYCVYIKSNENLGKNCGKLALLSVSIPFIILGIFMSVRFLEFKN